MGWRRDQENMKKGKSRARMLAAKHRFHSFDEVWFYVLTSTLAYALQDHIPLHFQVAEGSGGKDGPLTRKTRPDRLDARSFELHRVEGEK